MRVDTARVRDVAHGTHLAGAVGRGAAAAGAVDVARRQCHVDGRAARARARRRRRARRQHFDFVRRPLKRCHCFHWQTIAILSSPSLATWARLVRARCGALPTAATASKWHKWRGEDKTRARNAPTHWWRHVRAAVKRLVVDLHHFWSHLARRACTPNEVERCDSMHRKSIRTRAQSRCWNDTAVVDDARCSDDASLSRALVTDESEFIARALENITEVRASCLAKKIYSSSSLLAEFDAARLSRSAATRARQSGRTRSYHTRSRCRQRRDGACHDSRAWNADYAPNYAADPPDASHS